MVDKLHDYQGTIGQLHTIRENVKSGYENWKENHSGVDTRKVFQAVLGKHNKDKDDIDDFAFSHLYRRKTKWELIRLCSTVMGIEFTYSAITAFSSPILLENGVKQNIMSLVFALSPLLGFFLSPVTGSLSDRCENRYGRRRIFIVIFSIFEIFGLLLIAYGKSIGKLINGVSDHEIPIQRNNTSENSVSLENIPIAQSSTWIITLTIIGIVIADYCADALQNPSRAYLLDVCDEEDHTRGLSMFTVLAGTGGTFGYAIGSINWDNFALGHFMGGHVKTVFTLTAILFTICVISSITTFREVPLKMINRVEMQYRELCAKKEFENLDENVDNETTAIKTEPEDIEEDKSTEKRDSIVRIEESQPPRRSKGSILIHSQKESQTSKESMPSLDVYLSSIIRLPYSIRILLLTNVLCWMSHVSYSLYFTDYVGEAVFGGDPKALPNSPSILAYEEGIRFACYGMTVYSFSCLICSLSMEKIIHRFGLKKVYITNIVIDSISMFCMYYFNCKVAVILFSFASGVLYCTIFTIPYIIVARYHTLNVFEVDNNGEYINCKQIRGLGTDISIIGSSVFIAQFILSCFMGSLVDWCGSTSAVPLTCCVLSVLGVLAATQVVYLDM